MSTPRFSEIRARATALFFLFFFAASILTRAKEKPKFYFLISDSNLRPWEARWRGGAVARLGTLTEKQLFVNKRGAAGRSIVTCSSPISEGGQLSAEGGA